MVPGGPRSFKAFASLGVHFQSLYLGGGTDAAFSTPFFFFFSLISPLVGWELISAAWLGLLERCIGDFRIW